MADDIIEGDYPPLRRDLKHLYHDISPNAPDESPGTGRVEDYKDQEPSPSTPRVEEPTTRDDDPPSLPDYNSKVLREAAENPDDKLLQFEERARRRRKKQGLSE